MHRQQFDIMELHKAFDAPVADRPTMDVRRELRIRLIKEEAEEACEAIEAGNLLKTAQELCDIIVVAYGTAVECGLDLEPFWQEIHRANLDKVGGGEREDGKQLKPEGWMPPNLLPILERQMWNGHVSGCHIWAENGEFKHEPGEGCEWV